MNTSSIAPSRCVASQNRTIALASLVLALFGIARADEELVLHSSGTVPVANIDGSFRVVLDYPEFGPMVVGDMVIAPHAEYAAHQIVASPVGPGWVLGDALNPNKFAAYFQALGYANPLELEFDSNSLRYQFTSGSIPGYLEIPPNYEVFSPDLPGRVSMCLDLAKNTIGFDFTSPFSFQSIEWQQFVVTTISFGGHTATGQPWSATMPASVPIRTFSNGGGDPAHAPHGVHDATTMQGYVTADGSTTFVDSQIPGQADYVGGGGGGSSDPAHGKASMTDAPHVSVGGATSAGKKGASATGHGNDDLEWVKIRMDFTTYLLLDGQITWRFTWHYVADLNLLTGAFSESVTPDGSAAATSFSSSEQTALNNYNAGNYHGG